MSTRDPRPSTLSPSSNHLALAKDPKPLFYIPELESPIFASALFHSKQSDADGHPAIYSIDVLDNDPQTTCSHDEATILEPHAPTSFTEHHIMDHKFTPIQSGSLFKSTSQTELKVAKKRRSLQSIFVPSFLYHSPPSAESTSTPSTHGNVSRMRSYSSAVPSVQYHDLTPSVTSPSNSPPLEFLLDDDPFAKLSVFPSTTATSSTRPCLSPRDRSETPSFLRRSPLSPTAFPGPSATIPPNPPHIPTTPSTICRTQSSASTLARSAHKKPAFATRPSLPSLHTLAQINVVSPKKARKGRVGGNLPYEPWDIDMENNNTVTDSSVWEAPNTTSVLHDDVTSNEDFLDFSNDAIESDPYPPFDTCDFADLSSLHAYPSSNMDEGDLGRTSTDVSPDHTPSLVHSTSSSSRSSSDSQPNPITPQKQDHFEGSSSSFFSSVVQPQSSPAESDVDILNSPPDLGYFSSATSQIDYLSDQDPDLDIPSYLLWPSNSITPRTSFFAVGASGGQELIEKWGGPAFHPRSSTYNHSTILPNRVQGHEEGEVVDGSGRDRAHGENGRGHSRDYDASGGGGGGGGGGRDRSGGGSGGGSGGNFGGWNQPSGSGSGGGGRRGNDRDDRQRSGPSSSSTPLESDASSSEDDQTSTDDYGEDSPRLPLRPPGRAMTDSRPGSDDDVPLAQRIPTALRAQRTIRRQVRDERDQRRQERAALREQQAQERGPSRPRQQTLRPAVASPIAGQPSPMSSSQEAALHASASIRRPRTKTLPGNTNNPFAAEDLTQKLLNIEAGDSLPPRKHNEDAFAQFRISPSQGQAKEQPQVPAVVLPTQERGLRSTKSFHRPAARVDDSRSVPVPALPKLNRSVTTPNGPRRDEIPREESRRPSTSGGYSPRVSVDSNAVSPQGRSQRRPMPPVHPADALANFHPLATKVQKIQQRIFISDMQRFNIVEIESSTNAGEVLRMFKDAGGLEPASGGGWMLWEVAQDFGMERPIRSFELLFDISASWNADKLVNMFVLKVTHLEPLLSRSAIPESSPTHRSWVQWESKRGKWSKRWMELREHGLWLSKRETGKDEMFLCSLSTFDAYYVTRLHKAPKPFVFAVKSTENLSLFENTADYVHIFSCSQKEGEKFVEKLLLARSYVLFQERNVLFNKSSGTGIGSGIRKHSTTSRPTQPLVQVSAPFTVTTSTKTPFEPGSLLAKP